MSILISILYYNGDVIWYAVLNTIKIRNTWCPQYSRCSKLNIDIAKEIAFKKGGNVYRKIY
jgi:hypothetical protein